MSIQAYEDAYAALAAVERASVVDSSGTWWALAQSLGRDSEARRACPIERARIEVARAIPSGADTTPRALERAAGCLRR